MLARDRTHHAAPPKAPSSLRYRAPAIPFIPDNTLTSHDPVFYVVTDTAGRRIETYRGSDAHPKETFFHHQARVFGSGGGGPLLRTRNTLDQDHHKWATHAGSAPHDERYYYATDSRSRPVALVSAEGKLVEQYRYSGNGMPFTIPLGDVNADGKVESKETGDPDRAIAIYLMKKPYEARADMNLDGVIDTDDETSVANSSGAEGGLASQARSIAFGSQSAQRASIAANVKKHPKPSETDSANGSSDWAPSGPTRIPGNGPTIDLPGGTGTSPICRDFDWAETMVMPPYVDLSLDAGDWNNSHFVEHYLGGSRNTVDLSQAGLADDYWNHPAIKSHVDAIAQTVASIGRGLAGMMSSGLNCPYLGCVEPLLGDSAGDYFSGRGRRNVTRNEFVQEFPSWGQVITNPGAAFDRFRLGMANHWTFSIGGHGLQFEWHCSASAGCDSRGSRSRSYNCSVMMSISDQFEYPLDLDHIIGRQNANAVDRLIRNPHFGPMRNWPVNPKDYNVTVSSIGFVKGWSGRSCTCG
jgi:hypothetical protein